MPRGGEVRPLSEIKRSGLTRGKTTKSHNSDLIPSTPPTSLNVTEIWSGSNTSLAMRASYSVICKSPNVLRPFATPSKYAWASFASMAPERCGDCCPCKCLYNQLAQ
eukprot:scaffold46817_cov54-Attheya_sp.AAC.3